MATSREVAEAYIEVHGDLSEFRKDLDDAGDSARRAGEANADEFSEGWNKRIKAGVGDRWESMLDAMYTNNPLDWNRLIGQFDTSDLDRADVQIHDFMERMREAGKLNQQQYDEVSASVRRVIKEKQNEMFVQRDLENITRAHTEALRENIRVDRIRSQEAVENVLEINRAHAQAMQDNLDFDRQRTSELTKQVALAVQQQRAIEDTEISEGRRPGLLRRTLDLMIRMESHTQRAHSSSNRLSKIFEGMHGHWLRMDHTVRLVLTLIAVASGPMAVLGSGLAGAATAMASSFALALGSLLSMGGPLAALGVSIGLAVSSFDEILTRLPRIQESLDRISASWAQQADNFGRQWEGALDRILDSFASRLEEFDFGTPMGKSLAEITDAFDGVVNGPSFNAFMTEMTTNFPAAVSGIGRGLAGLTEGFLALFAGAGPVARQLGEDFANWGNKISDALEKARSTGEINRLFEEMRESLLVVLDLVGSLGMALGSVFRAGAGSGNSLLRSLTGIVDKFTEWTKTDQGRETLLAWFESAERIIRALEPVAVGLGRALAILVTPHMIRQFEDLMGSVGELLPLLAEVLKVVSDLGILNILADALVVVGQAIQPLLPPLGELARVLGPVIQELFKALGPLLVAVATALVPVVSAIADLVAQVAPELIPALERLVEVTTPIITKVVELAAAIVEKLAPVLGAYLIQAINSTVFAFEILAAGVQFVVDVVTTVVTALIDFFFNLETNITNFNNTVNEGFNQFWTGVQNMFTSFITGFQTAWDGFWGGLGVNISNIWLGIQTQFTTGWTNLQNGFNEWVVGFQTGWDTFWGGIGEGLGTIWTNIQTALTDYWNQIVEGFTAIFVTPFQQFWDAFWNGLDPQLRAVLEGISLAIQTAWQNILRDGEKFFTDLGNGWNGMWSDIGAENDKRWKETVAGYERWTQDINRTVNNFINDRIQRWSKFFGDMATESRSRWNESTSGFNNWAGGVNTTVNNFINDVMGKWDRFWGDVAHGFSRSWQETLNGFNGWANNVNSTVRNFINNVINGWNGFWNDIGNRARNAMVDFQNNIANGLNQAYRWFGELPGNIGRSLSGLANQLWYLGRDMIMGLVNGVKAMAQNVINAVSNVIGGAINWAKSLLKIASPSKVFEDFGEMTGEGYIVGLNSEKDDIRTATERMLDGAFESFDRSKAMIAGMETGRGIADGLEASKSRIKAALGNIDPAVSGEFAASVAAKASSYGIPTGSVPTAGAGVVLQEGAVQLVSKATNPELLADMVIDGLGDVFADRSKV